MLKISKGKLEYVIGLLSIILLDLCKVYAAETYEPTHVRTWTGWYNTHHAGTGGIDDERVISIRKRGYQICSGHSPIDAVCRDVHNHVIMFNADTTRVTDDSLVIACTTGGLLCRDIDQKNHTCRDYEIRFECLGAKDEPPPPNLGVIGVAAGLSVVVPILCVAVMHMARLCRDRGRAGSRDNLLPGNSEQSSQTDISDLPPSYSVLFPDCDTNSDTVSQRGNNPGVSVALIAPALDNSGRTNLPNTRLSSGSLSNLSDYYDAVNQPLREQNQHQGSSSNPRTSTWRCRFPNMHLSVFDLFMSSDRTSRSSTSHPPSPDPSYVQTPPPTYKEAIVILGVVDSKDEEGKSEEKLEEVFSERV